MDLNFILMQAIITEFAKLSDPADRTYIIERLKHEHREMLAEAELTRQVSAKAEPQNQGG